LLAKLRDNKQALIELLRNENSADADSITPDHLARFPLVTLSSKEMETLVRSVPGGESNVQDIYPLAPMQEGILFHYLLGREGDPYLLTWLLSFDSRDRVGAYLDALQAVIQRHDILRTAVFWEGVPEPVQVVQRRATLHVEHIDSDMDGD